MVCDDTNDPQKENAIFGEKYNGILITPSKRNLFYDDHMQAVSLGKP